jgi:hypothetical protein
MQDHLLKNNFAIACFFKSWSDLTRCMRAKRRTFIHERLDSLRQEERPLRFRAISGQLSGSESAYAIWKYNLMLDDPRRTVGATV